MPRDPDRYDFFVSYARADNRAGWITAFVEEILAEHLKFTGGRKLTHFFDKNDIRSFDDWQHSLNDGLQHSRLFLAFISPNYFASQWCRREWQTWIDLEIAKHILNSGAAPIYFVEVPGFVGKVPGLAEQATLTEQQVAAQVAALCQIAPPLDPFTSAVAPVVHQMRDRRQVTSDFVVPFHRQGLLALQEVDLRRVLERLAKDLDQRAEYVRRAAESENTVPPYNKNFSGRLEELLDLRKQLDDDRAGVISGVHGLGGVGKTELAFTYAHAFAGAYPGGRFLIECDGKSNLRDAFLGTGSFTELFRSQIGEEEQKQPETYFAALVQCLRERLASHGRTLLVLDNVTDANLLTPQETDRLTSLGPMLHLLATTRLPAGSSKHIAWLTLGELPAADALTLLEKHRPFNSEAERAAAQGIVRRLGGFALAVELVATFLAAHPSASYVGLEAGLDLGDLATIAEDTDIELRRHNERRLEAILAPLLESLSPAERLTIEYAAILPPDHVALPWLKALVTQAFPGLAQPGSLGDPWQELCGRLLRLSLFSRAAGEGNSPRLVRIHRLVQDLVKRKMSAETLAARQESLLAHIGERDAMLQKTTRWVEARWELEPLDALATLWADEGMSDASWLLNQIGQHWDTLNSFARAEPLMRRALVIGEASFGPEHPKVAIRLMNLARLLQTTNRLAEAEPLMRRALVIDEASFGPEHPEVAIDLNNFAQLLQATNRLAEAEPLMRRALAITAASFGPEHPKVAIRLVNLARLLQATNRLAEAEPLVRRALAIDEASFGPEHPEVAIDLTILAQLLQATNRLVEAEPLMRRALMIGEASFGPEHPKVAIRLVNLARLLQSTNRLAEAEPLVRRALVIDEGSFGPEHPEVAVDLNNLAQLLQATNRLAEAEPLMRRALAIDEASFGPEHPKVAIRLINLARLLQTTKRLAEAEPLMRRAVAIDEASFGPEHPDVAIDLNILAQLLKATNRLAEAEPLMQRAIKIFLKFTQATGHHHPHLRSALGNYFELRRQMGKTEKEAKAVVDALLNAYGVSLGEN